ncbi:hypothetical protein [Prosthecobacter sp.]|uniref:hypothetical protein n=1 Tax=Prosthecobacter sp. TaxID=1965333 RepID=UPI0037848936
MSWIAQKDAWHFVWHVLFQALSSNAANGTPRFHRRRATAGWGCRFALARQASPVEAVSTFSFLALCNRQTRIRIQARAAGGMVNAGS